MVFLYGARLFFNLLLWFLGGRVEVKGLENLPAAGPYLVVTNHMSIADSPLLFLALPPMRIHFWIADKWKTMPLFGYMASRLGGIFINRDIVDRKAIREAVDLLKAGEVVGLAPEATRSPVSQMIRPRNGAAYLASRVSVPIVPLVIAGNESLFPNFQNLRRTQITVTIGEPFQLPDLGRRAKQRDLTAFTDYIMLHLARLLPARYHGYYQIVQHPGLDVLDSADDLWQACQTFQKAA